MEFSAFVQRCDAYFDLVCVGWIWLQQSISCIGQRLVDMQSGLIATLREGEWTDHASALGIVEQLLFGLKWRRYLRLEHGLMQMGHLRVRIVEHLEYVRMIGRIS